MSSDATKAESETIRLAVGGDPDALTDLLRTYRDRLLRYVAGHFPDALRNANEPSDILQDVYLQAVRRIGQFQPSGEDCVFRWLVTMARNRMIDLLRLRSTQQKSTGEVDEDGVSEMLEELVVYRRTPSRSAVSHEFVASLERAIDRLPDQYRQVITLRYLEGLSAEETAARIGRAPDAVYWLCCRALKAIRADLRSASLFT